MQNRHTLRVKNRHTLSVGTQLLGEAAHLLLEEIFLKYGNFWDEMKLHEGLPRQVNQPLEVQHCAYIPQPEPIPVCRPINLATLLPN